MAGMVICRWLAVLRYGEQLHVLRHQRQHTIEPISLRLVFMFGFTCSKLSVFVYVIICHSVLPLMLLHVMQLGFHVLVE